MKSNFILHKNISATLRGKSVNIDVEEYTRGGSKSPTLLIFIHKGKRYVPYKRKGMDFYLTLNGLFKMTYSDALKDIFSITKRNPFLDFIPKTEPGESFSIPVILGTEHGVTFESSKLKWWQK